MFCDLECRLVIRVHEDFHDLYDAVWQNPNLHPEIGNCWHGNASNFRRATELAERQE